jgi:hypothetical protein
MYDSCTGCMTSGPLYITCTVETTLLSTNNIGLKDVRTWYKNKRRSISDFHTMISVWGSWSTSIGTLVLSISSVAIEDPYVDWIPWHFHKDFVLRHLCTYNLNLEICRDIDITKTQNFNMHL